MRKGDPSVLNTKTSGRSRTASRRQILRGGAAAAGAAIGSGAVRGFPTIWAQSIKDVTLVHIGGSFAVIKQISDQAGKDLGFKVGIQAVNQKTLLQRSIARPQSLDIENIDNSLIMYL
jgi:putative spermidine/putrescine transport system substrate-binding protein